jgi:hypothetical protein
MKRIALIPVVSLVVVALSACGGEDKDKAALDKACPIAAPAMKGTPALPGNFPNAKGLIYTSVRKAGPTTVASGYITSAIGDAHSAFSTTIKGASGYTVTKEEQDVADAEVNFSGAGNSGQVKLVQICKARTTVTITIRPA